MAIFYTDTGSFNILQVTGSQSISSSASNVLNVLGSGSGILQVSGSRGGLLAIGDYNPSTSILFQLASGSVNVLTVTNTSTAITGSLGVSEGLTVSQSVYDNQNAAGVALGAQTLLTAQTGSFTAAFYNYTVASASNARAGQFITVWSGSSIQYTDNSTTDIGNTGQVNLTASLSGNNVLLTTVLPTAGWTIKTVVNLI